MNLKIRAGYGWHRKGEVKVRPANPKSVSISVLVAISTEFGYMGHKVMWGGCTTKVFISFNAELIKKY